MSYPHSLVIIAPAALKPAANAIGEAIGWTGDNLSVPLSASGTEPATHWACHAWAQEIAVAWLTGQAEPPESAYTPEQIAGVLAQLTISVDANGLQGGEHFAAVIADANLQRVEDGA